ncbi:MAG: ferrochelatase [Ignavibacteria bacterium]|jgi:ferrochelatase|nr:ferrochelatase [Ignavibacteria bacterium]MCU7503699.1 ferrochelatase [Ignavibacteria bacterium]MCU7517654.1 ferrochelatase [Ignavibacteria bacterium]
MRKTAVVLFNLGGPDSLEAVEPFLTNLFSDRDIFNLPFQDFMAKFIASRRAPKVVEEYKLIGGKSPIGYWTELQRKNLEESLRSSDLEADVYTAMRYWHPLTADIAREVSEKGYEQVVLLPLYPHFSSSTTGSSFNEWDRAFKNKSAKVIRVNNYYDNPAYIRAINERIDEALLRFPEGIRKDVHLVFSAHGTPVSYVKKGDPYSHQIKKTVELVMEERENSHEHHECFQSKVGPVKWLEPSTSKKIEELALLGRKHLLLIPVSFVSDHVETLYELGIEYKHVAEKAGIENYIVMTGLNDSPLFVEALCEEVLKKLNG